MSYRNISVEPIEQLPDSLLDPDSLPTMEYYNSTKPIFFLHNRLKGTPQILKNNVCWVDYSIAKGGKLVAYRLNEEKILKDKNLIYVL